MRHQGTTVRLYLPQDSEEVDEPTPTPPSQTPVQGARVLVVDDEPGVRDMLAS